MRVRQTNVIPFPGHKWYRCKIAECHCAFCDGGLVSCTVCGGAEGSLPTDCPGYRLSEGIQGEILAGRIDYGWKKGWHLPAGAVSRVLPVGTDIFDELSAHYERLDRSIGTMLGDDFHYRDS